MGERSALCKVSFMYRFSLSISGRKVVASFRWPCNVSGLSGSAWDSDGDFLKANGSYRRVDAGEGLVKKRPAFSLFHLGGAGKWVQ